jgi:hypothetical protein
MLKDLIKETAAGGAAGVTSAGAVAGYRERIGDKRNWIAILVPFG